MKKYVAAFIITVTSFGAFAENKIVNAHLSKESIAIQVQNSENGKTKWLSTGTVGIINDTLGCDGTNCFATNLKNNNGGVYGEVTLQGDKENSLKDVYLVGLYEDTLINPSQLVLLELNGKLVLALNVK